MEQFTSLDGIYEFVQGGVGASLFTVSVLADKGTSMARVFTTHPEVYPVGGKKTFARDTSSIWLKHVIEGRQPFLGKDKEAVRAFLFDHATIEALGCGAIINVPVIQDGIVIGSINLLDAEGSYDEQSVEEAVAIAEHSTELVKQLLASIN